MNRKKSPALLILGICLILASLGLLLSLQFRSHRAEENCKAAAAKMANLLPEAGPGTPEMYIDPAMPVLEIDGNDYVALLDVPAFGITLPVARNWDGSGLCPARYWGSAYNHSLVIGGGDHPWQFGFCDKIDLGAIITVTDMTGTRFAYTVARVDRAKEATAQWLTDGDFDLTIFCHDTYSMEYLAVRCVFAYR